MTEAPVSVERPVDPAERLARFSTFAPWLQIDAEAPLAMFDELRDSGPVVRSEEFGGFWILTRHEDIEWAAQNPQTFRNEHNLIPWRDTFGTGDRMIPLELDGEEHRRWRVAMSDTFSPGTVNHFAPRIREAAVELIDTATAGDRCDFVQAIAAPLPGEAFLIDFGVPRSELQNLLDYKNWLVREGLPNATSDAEIAAANKPLREFFSSQVDDRRANGSADDKDVISQLLRARMDGEPLEQDDIVNACFVSMMASLDTTTSALSLAWMQLARRPDLQQAARDETKRTALVEELIRQQPVLTTARLVVERVERHGVTFEPGDMVLMSWGMAGRDREVYDAPAEIRLDRPPARTLAFGVGPHRCLGMHLARRIIHIALEEWHARVPAYRLDPAQPPFAHYSPVRGLLTLPLIVG
jgi:cytochrome P450